MRHATTTANPIATANRRAKREHRFDPDAACVRCGIATLETLVPMKRRFLEDHHVCGRANDDTLTVPVCRNCHAILTEGQHAAGVVFDTPPTLLHQIAAALTSFFTFLHEMSERGVQWAVAILTFADALDTAYPEWRGMPEAKALGGAS